MITVKVHEDYREIDARNRMLYGRFGRVPSKSGEHMYRCTVCGSPASIDEGYSDKGRNFVCGRCAMDESKFPTTRDLLEWKDGGDHGR